MKPVVVAGAVAAGMSAASVLRRNLPEQPVIVYGREEYISYGACGMPYFVGGEIKSQGVTVRTGTKVVGIEGSDRVEAVQLEGGERIPAPVVLVSVGIRPNSEVAERAGLELGDKKAIMVDRYLKTADLDMYAGGENIVAELSGAKLNTFPGVLGSAMIKIFDGEVAKTGIGDTEIQQYGLEEVESVSITSHTLAGYYPGAKRSGRRRGAPARCYASCKIGVCILHKFALCIPGGRPALPGNSNQKEPVIVIS